MSYTGNYRTVDIISLLRDVFAACVFTPHFLVRTFVIACRVVWVCFRALAPLGVVIRFAVSGLSVSGRTDIHHTTTNRSGRGCLNRFKSRGCTHSWSGCGCFNDKWHETRTSHNRNIGACHSIVVHALRTTPCTTANIINVPILDVLKIGIEFVPRAFSCFIRNIRITNRIFRVAGNFRNDRCFAHDKSR